jgi:hypothetical protein
MNAIITAMRKTIMTTVHEVATKRGISDVDALVADVMSALEIPQKKAASVKEGSVKSEGGKKRVVSKKMKENFLKLDGATEDKLTEIMKEYKEAAEVTSFEAFAREKLGLPALEEKPKKEKKAKKEKSGRFDKWTPTSTKLFKTIVEDIGGAVTDELKKEWVEWLDGLTDEDYASSSIQGHMRAYVTSKFVKAEEKKVEEEDEDLEEIEFEGETLSIGVKSGKIYRTEDEVDILVGYAGKGRFNTVKKPE